MLKPLNSSEIDLENSEHVDWLYQWAKEAEVLLAADNTIIELVRSIMDNGTGKAETVNEHVLIKLLQLRGTPMTCFKFDQKRVDECYKLWQNENSLSNLSKLER